MYAGVPDLVCDHCDGSASHMKGYWTSVYYSVYLFLLAKLPKYSLKNVA